MNSEIQRRQTINRLVEKVVLQKRGLSDYDLLRYISMNLEIDSIEVVVFREKMKANGLAKKGIKRLLIRENIFVEKDHKKLAGVILHEYAHILGFRHFPFLIKKLSVPYQIQSLL